MANKRRWATDREIEEFERIYWIRHKEEMHWRLREMLKRAWNAGYAARDVEGNREVGKNEKA